MPQARVCIVGAGVIGLTCAWRLSQAGFLVTLVDPHPGSGASHVAAGMLAPVTEASYGEENLAQLCLQAAARWPGFAKELEDVSGREIDYLDGGTLLVGSESGDHEHLKELHDFHQRLGLSSRLLGPSACRELEPTLSPRLRGGIFAPQDHQVDNRALLGALLFATRSAGVELITAAGEIVFDSSGALRGVTAGGRLHEPDLVVLATGYRAPALLPDALRHELPLRPIKGQILRLHLADAGLRQRVTVRAFVDGRSIYVVPRRDGKIVVGATMEEKGEDLRVTAGATREMLDDATLVLPSLAEAELLEASTGLRPTTPDNVAIVGASSVERLFYAAGHFRNGILFAPLTAEVLTAAISTDTQPRGSEPFAPVRFFR